MSDDNLDKMAVSSDEGVIRPKTLDIPKKPYEKKKKIEFENLFSDSEAEPSTSKKSVKEPKKNFKRTICDESSDDTQAKPQPKKKRIVKKKAEKVYKIGNYSIKESGLISSVKKALTHTPVIIIPCIFENDETNQ